MRRLIKSKRWIYEWHNQKSILGRLISRCSIDWRGNRQAIDRQSYNSSVWKDEELGSVTAKVKGRIKSKRFIKRAI